MALKKLFPFVQSVYLQTSRLSQWNNPSTAPPPAVLTLSLSEEWQKITCFHRGAICHSRRDLLAPFVGAAISKTRLIWLKRAIMFPDKGPNSRGGKRNFTGRRLCRKWHFCVKGGFPWRMEPSWRMDRARPCSGVLSHTWRNYTLEM